MEISCHALNDHVVRPSLATDWEGGRAAHPCVDCFSRLTIDHEYISRRSTVPTLNRDTSNLSVGGRGYCGITVLKSVRVSCKGTGRWSFSAGKLPRLLHFGSIKSPRQVTAVHISTRTGTFRLSAANIICASELNHLQIPHKLLRTVPGYCLLVLSCSSSLHELLHDLLRVPLLLRQLFCTYYRRHVGKPSVPGYAGGDRHR